MFVDADVNVQEVVPEVGNSNSAYVEVSKLPRYDSVVYWTKDKVYEVDLSAVNDQNGKNILVIQLKQDEEGRPVEVEDQYNWTLGMASNHAFLSMLANDEMTAKEKGEVAHEIGKVLQYNDGNLKIMDSDHIYCPQALNKEESLSFMTMIAKDVQQLGLEEDDYSKVQLSRKLLAMAEKLEDRSFTAQNVQSVMNTFGERETELMGGMERFNKNLDKFVEGVYLKHQWSAMMSAYANHRQSDYNFSNDRNDMSTEVKTKEEALQLSRESGGNHFYRNSPQENGLGQETYVVYGNGSMPHPYVVDSSMSNADEMAQRQLMAMVAGFKKRINGFGYNHDDSKSWAQSVASSVDKSKSEEMPVVFSYESKSKDGRISGRDI